MLIRRLRQIYMYDGPTGSVSVFGGLEALSGPQRVAPAPEQFSPYTDVIRIQAPVGWSYFLAEVVGAPGSEQFLNSADAAALLNVGQRTIRRWAKAGILEAQRTAGGSRRRGSWLVPIDSVRDLLEDSTQLDPGVAPNRRTTGADSTRPRLKLRPGQIDFTID